MDWKSLPRNNFPLDEAAPLSVFIAGGIGITPLRSMIRRMQSLGKPWRLHYAARTRQSGGQRYFASASLAAAISFS